jgi:hypothetical protein
MKILNSSAVEQSAVNRLVIGSNPIWGVVNLFEFVKALKRK